MLNALKEDFLKRNLPTLNSVISSKIGKFACKYLNTDMIMKHLSTVGPPINSALIVMVLAIGVTFKIIEALSTAIDHMT